MNTITVYYSSLKWLYSIQQQIKTNGNKYSLEPAPPPKEPWKCVQTSSLNPAV